MVDYMNNIIVRQNQEPFLKLLRARQQTYLIAKRWMNAQLVLTLVIPTIGALLIWNWPSLRATVAFVSLAIVFVDAVFVDRQYRQVLKRAAKIVEEFDCELLEMSWDQFTVGDKIDREEIHAAATAYQKHTDDSKLIDWYPKAVERAPMHFGRLVCQRANLRYDSQLRTYYGRAVLGVMLLVLGLLIVIGFAQDLHFQEWALMLVPAAPVLGWGIREYYRQTDTADSLRALKKEVEKLWEEIVNKNADAEICLRKSRLFQSGIFLRRANSPLTMPFLYNIMRNRLEEQMNAGAEELVREVEKASTTRAE